MCHWGCTLGLDHIILRCAVLEAPLDGVRWQERTCHMRHSNGIPMPLQDQILWTTRLCRLCSPWLIVGATSPRLASTATCHQCMLVCRCQSEGLWCTVALVWTRQIRHFAVIIQQRMTHNVIAPLVILTANLQILCMQAPKSQSEAGDLPCSIGDENAS